jgi:hypothetical protein
MATTPPRALTAALLGALAAAAGCAAPRLSPQGAEVKTIVGDPPGECRSRGWVTGERADSGGPRDEAALARIFNAAADLGANAVLFKDANDEELRGLAYACADLARATVVAVGAPVLGQQASVRFDAHADYPCAEIGPVESRAGRDEADLKAILAARAAALGANTLKLEGIGPLRSGGFGGSATAFRCPERGPRR